MTYHWYHCFIPQGWSSYLVIAENKINDNFKVIEKPKNGDLIQSTDEAQTLVNDELNETLDRSPTATQLVDENELGIPIIATIVTLKRKNKKCVPKEVFKLVKDSVETGITREKSNECLGQLISNKAVNHSTINSIECLSLPKNETNLSDSNNNDDTISHDNTNSDDDTCALKEDFNSYQVKCIKELQNVKYAFLKKLSDIEQNLERNFKEKEYDEKYMREF